MNKVHRTLSTLTLLLLSISLLGQNTYHVKTPSANLRSAPSTSAEVVKKLHQHDNLTVVESAGGWHKAVYQGDTVYAHQSILAPGKAIVSSYSVRTGAICRDGSRSSATGRGACSHHGGVSRWRYREEKSVRIIPN